MSKTKSSKYAIGICIVVIIVSMYFSIKSAIYLYTPVDTGLDVVSTSTYKGLSAQQINTASRVSDVPAKPLTAKEIQAASKKTK